jgi:hypothetical protein
MRLRNPTNGSWWIVQVRTIYVVPGEEQALGERTTSDFEVQ